MPESTTPSTPDSETGKNSKTSTKPRLTVEQKNDNHKEAENKRRNAIREHFTRLSQLVPGAEGQERSEQVMLTKTAQYLKDSMLEIRQLEAEAERRGIILSDEGRLTEKDYGGSQWRQPNLGRYEAAKAKKRGTDDDAEGEDEE